MQQLCPPSRHRLPRTWVLALLVGPLASVGHGDEPETKAPPGRPYKRAMMFSGAATDFVTFLGAYDAAVDSGYPPDVVFGASGGSVAAAIVSAFPERAQRDAFLASPAFHELMLSFHVKEPRGAYWFTQWPRWRLRSHGVPLPPRTFQGTTLASLPTDLKAASFDRHFPNVPSQPRIVIVAAELLWDGPQRTRAKQFIETWLTDKETANYLIGAASPIGATYPRSAVAVQPAILTDVTILQAVLLSIAEPYMLAPAPLGQRSYVGGAVDLVPIEVANRIADESIVIRQAPLDCVTEHLLSSIFLYSAKDRRVAIEKLGVTYLIDFFDQVKVLKDSSFWFAPKLVHDEAEVQAVPSGQYKVARRYLVPRCRIVDGVPEDHGEFLRRIQAQWNYGYTRGLRAFPAIPRDSALEARRMSEALPPLLTFR